MKKQFRNFKDAKKFVQSLKLKNSKEWRDFYKSEKRPDDIPTTPSRAYKNKGWKGMGDWLGTGNIRAMDRKFRTYDKAKNFVNSLKLKSTPEWKTYCKSGKKPNDIPMNPFLVYRKKGWKGMGDWLGTGNIASRNKKFRSFLDAKKFAQSLKIPSQKKWAEYCNSGTKPDDIPSVPRITFKTKWKGWGDWLGTGYVSTRERPKRKFQDARKFVHSLKLKNGKEWRAYCKSGNKPDDIPMDPKHSYKELGWKGLSDWLGTDFIPTYNREYKTFDSARTFVHSQGLKNRKEWESYVKSGNKPDDIPASPPVKFKNKGWKGWGDWLGTGTVASFNKKFRSYEDAKKYIRSLKIKNVDEWRQLAKSGKLPPDIPTNPWTIYSKKRKKK